MNEIPIAAVAWTVGNHIAKAAGLCSPESRILLRREPEEHAASPGLDGVLQQLPLSESLQASPRMANSLIWSGSVNVSFFGRGVNYGAAPRRWAQAESSLSKIGLSDAARRLSQEVEKKALEERNAAYARMTFHQQNCLICNEKA